MHRILTCSAQWSIALTDLWAFAGQGLFNTLHSRPNQDKKKRSESRYFIICFLTSNRRARWSDLISRRFRRQVRTVACPRSFCLIYGVYVCVSASARGRACKARRKEWAAEAAAGSRGPQGPGRRGQQAFLGTEGSTPHSTLPGAWWTEPHQGPPLPGPGQGSRARALALSPPCPLPPALPTTSTEDCWRRGKLPSLQKRERGSLGSAPTPVEAARTHTKTLSLFTSRPDLTLALPSFCLLEQFFYAQSRAV